MDKKKTKKRIQFNRELIRQLKEAEMAGIVGGFMSPCDAGVDSTPNSPNLL